MPSSRKQNHRAKGRHVGGFEEVAARNRESGVPGPWDRKGGGKGAGSGGVPPSAPNDGVEDSEEEKPKAKRTGVVDGMTVENPNARPYNEERDGVQLTRRQREEIEKNLNKKRYEELHKQGKTAEAKADLARLDEVKKRREEAAKRRSEEEESKKEKEVADKKAAQANAEQRAYLGGVASSKLRGDRSGKDKVTEKDKDADKDDVTQVEELAASSEAPPVYKPPLVDSGPYIVGDGSMKSCREVEDDFM